MDPPFFCDEFYFISYFFFDEKVGKIPKAFGTSQIANRQAFLCRTNQRELRPGNLPVRTDLAAAPLTARHAQPVCIRCVGNIFEAFSFFILIGYYGNLLPL